MAWVGRRRSYPRRPGSARSCVCCLSHAADRLRAHCKASKQSLNRSIGSIVPSGHSASTCHRSPSRNTTQKIGSGVAMKLTIFRNLQTAGQARTAFLFPGNRNPKHGNRLRAPGAQGSVGDTRHAALPFKIAAPAASRLHRHRALRLHRPSAVWPRLGVCLSTYCCSGAVH